jgi:hypothetical protein
MDRFVEWLAMHRVVIGVGLLTIGLGASVWLAFAASSGTPPDAAQSALLVMVGSLFNIGGAWAVSRRPGGPNLIGSRLAVRHLAKIATDVGALAALADEAFESRPAGKNREDVGKLSWGIRDIESRLITNVEDWAKVYPDLLTEAPNDSGADDQEEE